MSEDRLSNNEQGLLTRIEKLEEEISVLNNSRWKIPVPVQVAILGGALSLIGLPIAEFFGVRSSLALEQQQFQTKLVLQTLDGKSGEEVADSLEFLVNTGFIEDKSGKIRQTAHSVREGRLQFASDGEEYIFLG